MHTIDRENLKLWKDTEFRAALLDNERLHEALAVVAAGRQEGGDLLQCFRAGIAAFVWDVIDPMGLAKAEFETSMKPREIEIARKSLRWHCGFDPIHLGC